MGDIRTEHFTYMNKESWEQKKTIKLKWCVGHFYLSSVSTSLVSFAVAVTIRNPPVAYIVKQRFKLSALRGFIRFYTWEKNWSTDTSKRVTSS